MLHNLVTLLLILSPLVIGFFLPIPARFLPVIETLLSRLVLVILTFIGLSLSQVHNIGAQVGFIALHVAVLAICTMGAGLIALMMFDKAYPWRRTLPHHHEDSTVSIKGSLVQVGCVIVGFFLGKLLPVSALPIDSVIKGLLMLLILLVGMQLSHSGMTLQQVLLNKRGAQMSAIFCVSVAIGGLVFAMLMPEVSLMQGLALSSGYGWYSLSGIVMTDAYGAVWGSVALLNDLLREFAAILFIPMIMRSYPSAAIGLSGVTGMDFTLPVIRSSGGNEVIPMNMSFGFIVNLVAPFLMVLFSSFG